MMKNVRLGTAILCMAFGQVARAAPEKSHYTVEMHVEIPMRDGVKLSATIYKPFPFAHAEPVIFMMVPYPELADHPSGSYFAARGYSYAYVDTRGRGGSGGIFDPFLHDGEDGYDLVEWFARQPWSNGKVAMFGGSYGGGAQWLTAATHPPHLVSTVPVASAGVGGDFPTYQNIFETYAAQWLALTSGRVLYSQVFDDEDLWMTINGRLYADKAPFTSLPRYAGNPASILGTWLQHPEPDDYWAKRRLTPQQAASITTPMLEITGTHDADEAGALQLHLGRTMAGTPSNDYLVIGPWDHGGTRVPTDTASSFFFLRDATPLEHFGPAAKIDILRLHKEWYDYTTKGAALPRFLRDHLVYYVAGDQAECWKSAPSLSQVSRRSMTLALDASRGGLDLYHAGVLAEGRVPAATSSWTSDPNDLSAASSPKPADPGSQLHGDGLVFQSAPFEQAREFVGQMTLSIWLAADVPDTDLLAQLYLVDPDGSSHALNASVMRARYRHGLTDPAPIVRGKPDRYDFYPGFWFAVRGGPGSRLRLVLQSLNTPDLEKNYNALKPVAAQTGADGRIGHITLVQDDRHHSMLTVPYDDARGACVASANW